jgi:hypothetical protein
MSCSSSCIDFYSRNYCPYMYSENMKFTRLPEPRTYPRTQGIRCCKIVTSGTGAFHKRERCRRVARVLVDGLIPLCTQHAGEVALKDLLEENSET